ncbi:MAG: maleylpyruvate isomerase family mycothiol-dependent enzyme [Ornithinibacter sp.]
MSRPDLMALAEEERGDLLSLLGGLTDEQWNAPSLCTRWRVRDVASHVVSYDELSVPATVGTFIRGGLRIDAVNAAALRRYEHLEPSGILALLSRNLRPSGLPRGFGGGIALTDGTIHHQDIRRALNLPRTIPAHRLAPVLDFALRAPTLPAAKNAKALSLTATDVAWRSGDGPEVTGPAEALLMAVAGRPHALGDLSGPGLTTLQQRVG